MGTISDKLTYLNTTKSQIKTMINYGLETPLTNEPFRDYVSSIFKAFIESLNNPDTLFNNLPKITGTGTNISLNNTIEAPMKIELSPSELTQDGTPTPSSPQAVHSISGSNTIRVIGKNIFNINWFTPRTTNGITATLEDDHILLNGTSTGNVYINFAIPNNMGSNSSLYWYVKSDVQLNNLQIQRTGQNAINITPTTSWTKTAIGNSESYTYSGYLYMTSGITLNNCKVYIDVRNENIETSNFVYSPYNETDYSIDLKSKNLFDGTGWRLVQSGNGYPQPLTGATIVSSDKNNLSFTIQYAYSGVESGFIKVKANETYTLSFNSSNKPNRMFITQYDENKTRISTLNTYVSIIDTTTFTTTNDGYIAVAFTNTTTSQTTYEIKNIMIEKGSTQTEYAEYYDYGEYCKIGNYEDKFIRTSGKNLFDGEFRQGSDNATNNAINVFSKNNLLLEAGTYTFSCNLPMTSFKYAIGTSTMGFPNPASFIDGFHTTSSFTFTLNEKLYVGIMVNMNNNNITPNDITSYQFQIEKSSSATDYEPYGTNEWYIKNTIPEKVFDGTENWSYVDYRGNYYRYMIPSFQSGSGVRNVISNYFPNRPSSQAIGEYNFIQLAGNDLYIQIENQTTLNDFKTWLSTHNTNVYYPLATPTYTKIEGTLAEQLEAVKKSKDGTTNISQVNNDLGFVMSATALEDLV